MTRFIIKCVLFLLLLGGLFYLYKADRYIIDFPRDRVAKAAEQLSERLAASGDLLMLVTFDESPPVEWVSGAQIIQSGVEAVPGVIGMARRFDGHHRTFIETAVDWSALEGAHTMSVWVRLEPGSQNQEILFSRTRRIQTGIKLDQGRMAFFIPIFGRPQAVSYPFERYGEYVHIVAVADPEKGEAFLYEDGRLMASGPFDEIAFPHHNIEFGKRQWTAGRHPVQGEVDEAVIWRRALSGDEIAALYARPRSLLKRMHPTAYYRWRAAVRFEQTMRTGLKWVDYFNPGLHEGRVMGVELPEIDLVVSRSSRRHLNSTHRASLATGRRTRDASQARSVQVVVDGRAQEATLQLAGSNVAYAREGRPSYVLHVEGGDVWGGLSRIRLIPPEDAGFVQPLLESRVATALNIPSVSNGLCRLRINGESVGIYYYEDYSQMGVFPGVGATYPMGPTRAADWHSLFREFGPREPIRRIPLSSAVPLSEEDLFHLYDEVEQETRALFVNDIYSALNSREILHRLKWDRRNLLKQWPLAPDNWSPAKKAHATLTAYMVLGENPSPFYLLHDLDLNVLDLPGVDMQWTSSRPDLLTADGRVTRPQGDRPVGVELTATIHAGDETRNKTLRFRVVPEQGKIPALMIYVNETVKKARRVDAVLNLYPAGPDAEVRSYSASQGTRGGISHRGHTGYWTRRKAFSIRLDEPHYWLDDTTTKHIHLINGPRDPALVRNKLSYDLFRSFASEGNPRYAPEVQWVEVFINGRYHCLIEMSTRVQRRMFGYDSYDPDDPHQALIYKRENIRLWTTGEHMDMRTVYPARRHGHDFERYRALLEFIETPSADEFVDDFENWMDLANFIDYHILLNFTENRNGWPFNYHVHDILMREPGPGGRFVMVPWDFDSTFENRYSWYANNLFRRLQRDYPNYYGLLHSRWNVLREGPLHDDRLREQLDDMEAQLAGYAEWEYDRWGYNAGATHAELVEYVRRNALERAAYLDREIADRAAGDHVPDRFDALLDRSDEDEDVYEE